MSERITTDLGGTLRAEMQGAADGLAEVLTDRWLTLAVLILDPGRRPAPTDDQELAKLVLRTWGRRHE